MATLLLVCFAAPAMGAAGNNCADGGRPRPDDGGIGGTGVLSMGPRDEGGIGGTGISVQADTGIIGTVTGFASICVGGVEIHYAAETPVQVDGQPAAATQLAVGQVVEVEANGTGSRVSARQITVRHVVSGPVIRVDSERNQIDVIGQTVQLSPATRAGGGNEESPAVATAFPLDSFVQVSGMRRSDGTIVASRVSRGEPRDTAQLTGPVTKLDAAVLTVAGTQVRMDNRVQTSVGDEVHVVGRWDGSAIVARSVEPIPHIPFDGRVARLDIEGYARESVAGQLQVGPFHVELPQELLPDSPRLPAADARIRVQAVVRDHHVIVERITVISDLPTLPPVLESQPRSGNGGGSNDVRRTNGEPPPSDQPRADAWGAPSGAGRSDRPLPPQIPDRLPQIPDRPPQIPDRPPRPERPPRPDRVLVPERPARPDRPDTHGRP